MSNSEHTSPQQGPEEHFVTTRWTMVLAAGRKSSAQSERALSELCQLYWLPLYGYVRRKGHTREDAEDLVQAFFAKFLEKNYLERLSAEKGKFRAFLLASLKHFLANEWDRSQRLKRGGGALHFSLDWQKAEEHFHLEPAHSSTPEKAFDFEWAMSLLERVITRLQEQCAAEGKAQLFQTAKAFLMVGEDAIPYGQAASDAGLEAGTLRVAVHRLRKDYRRILRDEIAQTLSDPTQVDEELRSLRAALAPAN